MGFMTRVGMWLVLVAAGSGHSQAWRGEAWPVVLDSGDVYVCSANISYHLPDTLTDIQEGHNHK